MTSSEDIWFSGPVKDAVSLVAERNCVFLVYIYDDSEKSNSLNATLKDENVIETIKKCTVALSMEKDSDNTRLFGQFYPTQTAPILYLIKQGTIRDFGVETITSQELISKIVAVHDIPTTIVNNAPVSSNTVNTQQQDQELPASTITTSEPSPSTIVSADGNQAKKAELQKQLEQVRKERAEREQQEAKDREIKRRQEAKLMQEAKQSRVDKENKLYFEKIKKERLADEAHRKKVRQQIAADRAEKIAKRNAEKERQNSSSSPFENENVVHKTSSEQTTSHLNIRQLDGTNIRHRFEASTKLSSVREWIKENRTDDSRKSYKLSSQFPTRQFTEEDDNTCLSDLGLCPSATIIMKPAKTAFTSSSSLSSGGNHGGIVGYAVRSFDFVYGFIVALINILIGLFASLFSTNGPAPHTIPGTQQQQQQPILRNLRGGQRLGGESLVGNISKGESSANAKDDIPARKRNPYATRVNTLQEDDADDDKKRPTYNGNSVNHE